VLPLLDGTRDLDAIAATMAEAEGRGEVALNRARVDSAQDPPFQIARRNLEALLSTFARAALLLA
jgi:hypothetical protein